MHPRHSKNRTWMPAAVVALAALLAARSADAGKTNRISAVTFDDAGQVTTVRIRGSSTPTFSVYKLDRPSRVVIDVAGAELGDAVREAQDNGRTIPVGTWAVNQVAAYEIDEGGTVVRVVVTLARPGRYDVKAKGGDVVVTVTARDEAPDEVDAAALAEARAAAERAKKDSDAANAARGRAETDAKKARDQADAARKDAEQAKQALEAAKAEAARADKKSAEARKAAERALAEARAEAERTRKAAEAAKAEAERTRKAVEQAKADAERTRKAAEAAHAALAAKQQEVDAAKAEAAREKRAAEAARAEAARHKAAADEARDDAARARRAADAAKAETATAKEKAGTAAAEAERLEREAAKAREIAKARDAEAATAKAEAERRRAEAERAKADAAREKRAAEAAKAEAATAKAEAAKAKAEAKRARADADAAKADAAALRAEAEKMFTEAKTRLAEAEQAAKRAKASEEAAIAAARDAEKRERASRDAAAKAAAERKAAQAALDAAEKARRAGDRDAAKKIEAAEARLAKAEQARKAAEAAKARAERAAEAARAEAARRKTEAADAVAARSTAEQDKRAAEAAAAEADQRARRAEALRKDEEAAARKAAEARAAVAEAKRAKMSKQEIAARRAEAKKIEKAAAKAKQAREAEEAQLAGIVAERRRVEAELTAARAARAEAERAAAAARKDADGATKRAEAARREADEAERRAKAARADAEAARKEAEAARRAAKVAREETKTAAKAPAEKKDAKKDVKKRAKAPAKTVARAPAKPAAKKVAVRDVAFQQDGDDARVIVELSAAVTPTIHRDGRRAELVLTGAELPDRLQRKLDTRKFDGAVRAVSTYRDPKHPDTVRVVVDLAGDAEPRLEQDGATLRWHFASAPATAKAPAKKKAGKVKTQSIPAPVVGGYGASSSPVTSKTVAQAGGRRKVYRGPTIDLDFKDADIHNLLRFLANIGRVSIVVPDDIKATVTVRLKRVPWDQALEVILASKGLWYRKEGNLYRVAPRKVLDAEDEAEAERIRAAVASEVPEAEVFTLNYASADEMQEKLAPLLSPKGKIEVDPRTNSLIINDIRAHRRRVIDLAARLDTQTPQIMIEARIVEARSTFQREIGIQWGGRASASQAGGNATGLIFPNSIGIAGGAEDRETPAGGVASPSDFAVNLPATVGTGQGGAIGISLGSVGGNFNLNLRLSALEDTGSVRIISSPKITVLNNAVAEISQGVSIPISVVSAQGTQTQFVPADLRLTVTPYVSQRDCSIAMTIEVTKNEPDFVNTGARGDPTILRKEARTRILVADGETTVMGGITTRNTGLSYNKVPFFGDLPVIGWFFKSRAENDERTELLIFITPKITNKAFLRCE